MPPQPRAKCKVGAGREWLPAFRVIAKAQQGLSSGTALPAGPATRAHGRAPPAPSNPPSAPHTARPPARPRPCSIWDDGTANPEPCLDQFTLVSKYGALGMLLGGMGVFGVVGTWATWSAPEKRVPWVRARPARSNARRRCG